MPDNSEQLLDVTAERIMALLDEMGLVASINSENGIAINFFPNLLFISVHPGQPIVGVCSFHRVIDVQFYSQIASVVATINSEYYTPKLYSVVSDDGKIQLRLSHCFNWNTGASDEQIHGELDAFFSTSLQLLARLEKSFPDPWNPLQNER